RVGELLEVRRRDLAELHRIDGREAEVEDPGAKPVLPRARVLLEVAELRERRHVSVRRAPAQAERASEVADPELRRSRPELRQDRKPALERLGARLHVPHTKTAS